MYKKYYNDIFFKYYNRKNGRGQIINNFLNKNADVSKHWLSLNDIGHCKLIHLNIVEN